MTDAVRARRMMARSGAESCAAFCKNEMVNNQMIDWLNEQMHD